MKRAYQILFWGILVAAPLAVGSVHTSVVITLAALALMTRVLQQRALHEHSGGNTLLSVPSLAFWLLGIVCLLQIIPLPTRVVEVFNPQRWHHFVAGWKLVFPAIPVPRSWMPLSLDPAQTADRGLRWMTLALISLIACNHGRQRHAWHQVLRVVTGAGLAVLLVGAAQVFSGTTKVLFVYEPEASLKPFTTFISPNHAAVFFGLCSLCAFALALRSFPRSSKEALLASGAGLALMVAMSEQDSVGASIGYWVAMIALFGFFLQSTQSRRLLSEHRARRLSVVLFSLPLVAPLAAFLAWHFGPRSVSSALMHSTVGQWIRDDGRIRLELMASVLKASADFPILGAGAGATRRVLSPYLDWSKLPPAVVPTIENEPVEWLFHFGWLVAIIAIVLLVMYLVYAFKGHRRGHRLRYGAALAVGLFFAFNAQFHFPFFALGIAIPAIAVLEVAHSKERGGAEGILRSGHLLVLGGWRQWALVGAMAVAGIWFIAANNHFETAGDLPAHEGQRQEELNHWLEATPTDARLYAAAAQQASRQGEKSRSIKLAQHAVRLEPTAQMRLFSARTMWKAGREEDALDAYRHVFSPHFPQNLIGWIGKYLVPVVQKPAAIARALGRATPRQWRVAARVIRRDYGEVAVQTFALQLVDGHPTAYEPYRQLIRSYLRTRHFALAELWARMLISRGLKGADGATGQALLVQAIWEQGGRQRARRLAWKAFEHDPSDEDLAMRLVQYRTKDPKESSQREAAAIGVVVQRFCSHPENNVVLRRCWLAKGWLAERQGRLEDAEYVYERVQRKLGDPESIASFYARQGRCIKLNALISRLESGDDPRAKRLRRLTAECVDAREKR